MIENNINMLNRYILYANKGAGFTLLLIAVVSFFGCKKLVEADSPPTSINTANVYQNDATAISVLNGIYANLSNNDANLTATTLPAVSLYCSLSADELTLFNLNDPNLIQYYQNSLSPVLPSTGFWSSIYPIIFIANSAIEGITASQTLTVSVKQELLGEAKFIRAYCYFYLTNMYGNIPLVTTTDYKTTVTIARSLQSGIYIQIVQDLNDAKNLLSPNYLQSDAVTPYPAGLQQRIRPTKWAAEALLARIYLYINDFANAEAAATDIIQNRSLFNLGSLSVAFKMNSSETIWSLQPVNNGTKSNTGEGAIFILPSTGPNTANYPVYLSNSFISNFEINDQRLSTWVNKVVVGSTTYYYPYKYKVGAINSPASEYIMMLRLGEQYLIRSEARSQLNNIPGALADIDSIRSRAGLPILQVSDKASLLKDIYHERQVELFTEGGHRWFDLKRSNSIDSVMTTTSSQKGSTWSSYKSLYPIPQNEIILDPNLTQNAGY